MVQVMGKPISRPRSADVATDAEQQLVMRESLQVAEMVFGKMNRVFIGGVFFWWSAAMAWGAPSALIQIPTADVTEANEGYLGVATSVAAGEWDLFADPVLESCFGITADIELGYDGPAQYPGDGSFFVKKRLGAIRTASLAVGVNGIDFHGGTWNPHLVHSADMPPFRVHLGADYADKNWRAMVGVEYGAGEHLRWMGDWITGPAGAWSYGLNLMFGAHDRYGLIAGIIHENSTGDVFVYLNLGCALVGERGD